MKKKSTKRMVRMRISNIAKNTAGALDKYAWACLDGFCCADLILRIRAEIARLEPYYDPSEIWVGAESSVGAQINVPSVRGDKVLWMCGAHPRPEAVNSRSVDQKGGVEPCDGAVKQKVAHVAGVSKFKKSQVALFPALRELYKAIDT